ncbi:transposase [Chitinispirillales bacterium ANBcel5]|uniref:transposase n=1 Tax=Cellulosispirillum alkaliphilum TaxID=3039283 RepID=UPI002A586CFA|nr:transposase [Chitinispirillales bacterium ANBcel5]
MSTKPRIIVSQVHYQVRSDVISGVRLFPDKESKLFFQKELTRLLKACGYKCLSWSFSDDHYHLIIKTSDVPISGFMRTLNSVYAKYLNKKLKRKGRVFAKRISSAIIDDKVALKEVIRHVHLNPVRNGFCSISELDRCEESGHSAVIKRCLNKFQDIKGILNLFGNCNQIFLYQNYIKADLTHCIHYNNIIDRLRKANRIGQHFLSKEIGIIGEACFTSSIILKDNHRREIKNLNKILTIPLNVLHQEISHFLNMNMNDLFKRGNKSMKSYLRTLFASIGVAHLDYSLADLAEYLKVTDSAVSRMVSRGCGLAKSFLH